MARRNSVTGYMTTLTPSPASVAPSSSSVLPNSVMFTRSGASTRLAESFDLGGVRQRLGEYHVGSGVEVGLRPVDGSIEALDGPGIGARAYDEGRRRAGPRRPP